MDHFETMNTCSGYTEDVHVNFCRQKQNFFDKIMAFLTWTILRLAFSIGLCNQLLLGFSSNQFETMYRCYKYIEDVHVTFSKKENNF